MSENLPVKSNPRAYSDGRRSGDEPRDVASLKVAMSNVFDNLEDDDAREVFKTVVDAIDKKVGKSQQKRTNEMKNSNVKKPAQKSKPQVSPLQKMIRESVKNYLTEIDPNRWSYSGPDVYGEKDEDDYRPQRKNIVASEDGADEGEKMAELGEIAKELGLTVSGAKAAVQKALARVRALLLDIPTADQEIMVLRALVDYIEYLESSGELEAEEVTMLKANPAIVRELDGFREFLSSYVKDEMKKAGSSMQLGNAPGEELSSSERTKT
jgi:hypothetical protein